MSAMYLVAWYFHIFTCKLFIKSKLFIRIFFGSAVIINGWFTLLCSQIGAHFLLSSYPVWIPSRNKPTIRLTQNLYWDNKYTHTYDSNKYVKVHKSTLYNLFITEQHFRPAFFLTKFLHQYFTSDYEVPRRSCSLIHHVIKKCLLSAVIS